MEQGREDPQDAAWAQRAPFSIENRRGANERPRRGLVATIALAHLGLIALAIQTIREDRAPRARESIEIELLAPPPARAVPSPRGGSPPRTAAPVRDAAPGAVAIAPDNVPSAAPAQLFDENGALRLPRPDDDRFDRPPPAKPAATLRRKRALAYEPTRFEKYFVPDHETLGQRLVRKVPLLGFVLPGVNAPHCGTDPEHVPEECDPQRMTPDLNTLTHPLDTD